MAARHRNGKGAGVAHFPRRHGRGLPCGDRLSGQRAWRGLFALVGSRPSDRASAWTRLIPYSSHALAATAERVAYSNHTTTTAQVLWRRMDRDVTGRKVSPYSRVEADGIASAKQATSAHRLRRSAKGEHDDRYPDLRRRRLAHAGGRRSDLRRAGFGRWGVDQIPLLRRPRPCGRLMIY